MKYQALIAIAITDSTILAYVAVAPSTYNQMLLVAIDVNVNTGGEIEIRYY